MNENTTLSRRSVVKMLGGAAIALPIARTAYLGGVLTSAHAAGVPGTIRFQGMPAPQLSDPDAMARVTVTSKLRFDGADQTGKLSDLSYQAFFKTGDKVPSRDGEMVVAGGYYDIHGKPIMDSSESGQSRHMFSDCPDGMTLLQPIDGATRRRWASRATRSSPWSSSNTPAAIWRRKTCMAAFRRQSR